MEIEVTRFVRNADHFEYSASIAERGVNAGKETWNNAKTRASGEPLLTTEEQIECAKEWLADFGAWDEDEVEAWDAVEVNALLIQFLAGDVREARSLHPSERGLGGIDWRAYRRSQEQGRCSSMLFKNGRKVYASINN